MYRLSEHSASQAFDVQISDSNYTEILDQPERKLVLELVPLVLDSLVDGKSSATLVPRVADTEEDAGVVAGIVIAEAGVGVMDQVNAEID